MNRQIKRSVRNRAQSQKNSGQIYTCTDCGLTGCRKEDGNYPPFCLTMQTESGELGSAVNAYIERIRADRSIVPSFNTFYEYMRDDYRRELAEREIKVEKSDFNIDNMLTTMRQYYRGGRYDFLLNSTDEHRPARQAVHRLRDRFD